MERALERARLSELTHLESLVPFLATTGSAVRRLDSSSPTKATAAPASHTSAGVEPQPLCPPLDKNSVMPPTVSAMRTAPTQSI